jgi:hypothetical protein
MGFSLRDCDLAKLNSMTKYPSIPTYHELGEKGTLLEKTVQFDTGVILTEKIDGTNARIVLLPDGNFVLGSREELLYAKGDLIGDPALGIVKSLKALAEGLPQDMPGIAVVYCELYGGRVTAASKQYTSQQEVSWRLFDIAIIEDHDPLFCLPIQQIAGWRDRGGQYFLTEDELTDVASSFDIALTPRLGTVDSLPISIEEAYEFLKATLPKTLSAIDEGAGGRPEGIVARDFSRQAIAKLRFEDYERHMKRKGK